MSPQSFAAIDRPDTRVIVVDPIPEEESRLERPLIEMYHGTTTIAFEFDGAIITAVDSRASLGKFVGSCTTDKV
jgi:hypothetical protein